MAYRKVEGINSAEDVQKFIQANKLEIAKHDNAMIDDRGNIQFTLLTEFRWGRHKGNQLRDIFKVEPSYIEWCIKVPSGFAIYEPDLLSLYKIKVFDSKQLKGDVGADNVFVLDLTSLSRDSNGFLTSDFESNDYIFSPDYIQWNRDKINRGIDFLKGYQFGIPSENDDNILFSLPIRNKIRLLVPR